LEKHKLKKIRFHDLRHSCASVLLAQGITMKQIQEWLGHSDMSTTANIYSHLYAVTKAETGAAMSKALG
jgi:integrase